MEANKSQKTTMNGNFKNSHLAFNSIFSMFKVTIYQAKELLKSINDLIYEYSNESAFLTFTKTKNSQPNYIHNDTQLLELLYSTFESVFFKKFIPFFILHLHNILHDVSLAYEIVVLISSIIPLISELSKMISSYFTCFSNIVSSTTSSNYLIVESEHPYKSSSVTSYFVKFPSSIQWMSIEFDPKSSTAQEEDYLEV